MSKLNRQQKQEIRNSKPKPREETSTRTPFREVNSKKRKIESGISPLERPMDEEFSSQRILGQKSRTGEWVKEQQGLGPYKQTTTVEKLPSPLQGVGFERKNEDTPKPMISTKEQGSQVEKELPELLKKFVEEMVEERIRMSSGSENLRIWGKRTNRNGRANCELSKTFT